MARKDWYYIPIQMEQAQALDEMIAKEGKKYGIKDRTDLVRFVLGEFIYQYETTGKNIMKAKKRVCGSEDDDDKKKGNSDIIECINKDCGTSV